MEIKFNHNTRSYKSREMLASVVRRRLGEVAERETPWVTVPIIVDGAERFTAVVYLRENHRYMMRQIAEFGFHVVG